jgi:hypothetical protein
MVEAAGVVAVDKMQMQNRMAALWTPLWFLQCGQSIFGGGRVPELQYLISSLATVWSRRFCWFRVWLRCLRLVWLRLRFVLAIPALFFQLLHPMLRQELQSKSARLSLKSADRVTSCSRRVLLKRWLPRLLFLAKGVVLFPNNRWHRLLLKLLCHLWRLRGSGKANDLCRIESSLRSNFSLWFRTWMLVTFMIF